ncbi:MAG: hypothetical protein ACE14S_07130 [Candidatus Bathyarchaeia archaeon]
MSETTEDEVPGVLTSAVPEGKELNAEAVTSMSASFLKRIGHKGGLKPKRVSLEGDLYTVEVELSKFTATVKVDVKTKEIREYDVQPKGEESSGSLSSKVFLTMLAVSSGVTAGLYFVFKILGF